MKSKGAVLQLPALPKIKLGWRLISGLIFLLSFTVVITFTSLNTFKVSAVNLQGAERLSAETVVSQLGLSGTSIVKVQPKAIEAQIIERFPSLSSAKVSAGLPASVTIKVVERQPLVSWQQENTTWWIDSEGVMFPPDGEAIIPLTVAANSYPPAAPVSETETTAGENAAADESAEAELLSVEPAFPRTTPEFVLGILSLIDYIPEGSVLQYDPQFGLGWRDPNGWMVYFGKDITNIDLKLAEYQTIIAELREDNLTPALISLEFLHAPFYRLEQ